MAEVVWPQSLIDHLLEMPERERAQILDKTRVLENFPEMYAVRPTGPFRGHRCFIAGQWIVYYRVIENAVYLRAIVPARTP
jgi:hypothetical protein